MIKEIAAGVIGAVITALLFWSFGAFRDASSSLTIPEDMVAAYKADDCPTGWSKFTEGRGRYIVGLQPNGKLAQPVGIELKNEENRVTGKHSHMHRNSYVGGKGSGVSSGSSYPRSTQEIKTLATLTEEDTTISVGTNAPYVQLLFCIRD